MVTYHGTQNALATPPFYKHGLTLMSAWLSDHIPNKVWKELLVHSTISTAARLKIGNG